MALTNVDLDRIDGNSGSLANVSTSALNGGPLAGTRNRIINGDMRIDQRNAGASITPANGAYSVDRLICVQSTASKYSVQQNAGSVSVLANTGFSNYLGATSLSAYSVAVGDQFYLAQRIEANNCTDLAWGTASAKAVTLSFWVRSSLAGTFGGHMVNAPTFNYSYPFSYTISAADTWEYKTVTVAGPTAGTWNNSGTGIGIQVGFALGVGSSFSGTANAWSASLLYAPTGATSVVGTNGATFYITGVQLEAGTVATPFERRSYGQELALCQRYYYRVVSNVADNNYARLSIFGQCASSTTAFAEVLFPVSMRTNPTSLQTTGTANNYSLFNSAGSGVVATALAFNAGSAHSGEVLVTVASGLVAGNATVLIANNNTTAYLGWSAEL
jgi:hypothetical protein